MSASGVLESLLARYVERRVAGADPPDLEEICRDSPELVEPLRSLIRDYESLARKFAGDPIHGERCLRELAAASTLDPAASPPGGGPASRAPAVAPGSLLAGRYEIESLLGAGGMGEVYRARDTRLGREVAIKVLPAALATDTERLQRFEREARSAAALSHPNICVVHEVAEAGGRPFISMELVAGETLHERIRRGPLPSGEALEIAIQIASGLGEAHRRGVIHRDIKSANIMVTPAGQAKIMDFGLARLERDPLLTKSRTLMGTVPYMSPEQVLGDCVDLRTDLWSLGVVLYEMLSGQLPFRGSSDPSILHSITHDAPLALPPLEPPVPEPLRRVVLRALRKDLDTRYGSAEEMLADLEDYGASLRLEQAGVLGARALWRRLRRPRVALPALALLLALVSAGVAYSRHRERVRWAREVALPRIEQIVSQNWPQVDEAYALAEQAEEVIPDDPRLAELFSKCSYEIAVRTEPPGAEVYVKPYAKPEAPWRHVGVSPIEQVRLPFGVFRWKLEKPGYETVLAAATSAALVPTTRNEHWVYVPSDLERKLDPEGSIPAGMVRVAGADTPSGHLDGFFIDHFELTNREYKAFVDAGGYENPKYWKQPFLVDGKELPWEVAVARFVDRTGRPGPATWEAGGYPEGQGDYPVSGVSWYEATAYAEFVGKALPTKDHWGLARGEATPLSHPALGGFAVFAPFANFSNSAGPVAAGTLGGVTSYGAFDMPGNVREWCWNKAPEGRVIRGGAWNDPSYMFQNISQVPAMDRSPKNGFRCAFYPHPGAIPETARAPVTFEAPVDHSKATPVPDSVFESYKGRSGYDKADLNARVEERRETPEWAQEKVTFEAAYGGERMIAWLFLPRNARPPFQTVVYFPGSGARYMRSSEHLENASDYRRFLSFIVKNGRALLYPVYKGTYERGNDSLTQVANGSDLSFSYSELTLQEVKDFRRSIDYLETRPDIDAKRIAYYGLSWGGEMGGLIPAVEGRLAANVILAGGLYKSAQRPEIDPVNYASRVKVPTLMVTGRYDSVFPLETCQKPLFDLLGAPEKKWVLDDTDHIPTTAVYVREILAWLDRYLGPVRRSRGVEETPSQARGG